MLILWDEDEESFDDLAADLEPLFWARGDEAHETDDELEWLLSVSEPSELGGLGGSTDGPLLSPLLLSDDGEAMFEAGIVIAGVVVSCRIVLVDFDAPLSTINIAGVVFGLFVGTTVDCLGHST